MTRGVYLALGSNIGDREHHLVKAMKKISEIKTTAVLRQSAIYETKPVGYLPQQNFLNMVIEVETCLGPYELLKEILKIEDELGRTRRIHWGPRTIDIDILLYDDLCESTAKLTIPHERLFERAFMLIPLRDIYPFDSITGVRIDDLIKKAGDREGVALYKKELDYN